MSDVPCRDQFEELEDAYKAMNEAWEQVNEMQDDLALLGTAMTAACMPPAVFTPSGQSACMLASLPYFEALDDFDTALDKANEADLEGLAAAEAWQQCAENHKEFFENF
jgi:hypothetical protein